MSEKRQFWFRHIEQWQHSRLSQAEYARQQGLSITTFGYYRRCYAHQQPVPENAPASLLPVDVIMEEPMEQPVQTETVNTGITLTSPGGFRIELAPGFDSAALQRVLKVLEAA